MTPPGAILLFFLCFFVNRAINTWRNHAVPALVDALIAFGVVAVGLLILR